MITFAVVGHNEGRTLGVALADARQAAEDGDQVWFVDSASTDGSAGLAASLGVEVVSAPLGKGRALRAAIARCETPYICFLDADGESSRADIALALRGALSSRDLDMVVADFAWPAKRFLSATSGVYRPLVGALFPEALDRYGSMPFSGFRALRADVELGELPPGFGVETYLNLACVVGGMRTEVVHVGTYDGPVRPHRELGLEVAAVILDLAERHGRLNAVMKPLWERWVDEVVTVARTQPGPGDEVGDYPERLAAAAARPLPPADLSVATTGGGR